MTLSEIEIILEQLVSRHKNLTVELLTTLLTASGWEEKTIKEALVLFTHRKQKSDVATSHVVSPQIPTVSTQSKENAVAPSPEENHITFYQPVGSEEGRLISPLESSVVKKESLLVDKKTILESSSEGLNNTVSKESVLKIEEFAPPLSKIVLPTKEKQAIILKDLVPKELNQPNLDKEPPLGIATDSNKDPVSLITSEDIPHRTFGEKKVEIPNNLPLLPFESSPHVWSFSKYKDTFHSEPKDKENKEEIQVITVMPRTVEKLVNPASFLEKNEKSPDTTYQDKEVALEKVPLNRQDQSLVFLAGIMLLVIILILGYMYSNGRL